MNPRKLSIFLEGASLFFAILTTCGVVGDFIDHATLPAGWGITAMLWAVFYLLRQVRPEKP